MGTMIMFPFLGKDAICQELAVIRQALAGDGVPPVIILVVQRPLGGLSNRHGKQQQRGGWPCESANGVAAEKHDEGIVIQASSLDHIRYGCFTSGSANRS